MVGISDATNSRASFVFPVLSDVIPEKCFRPIESMTYGIHVKNTV